MLPAGGEFEMRKFFKYLFLALVLFSAVLFVQFSKQFNKEVEKQKVAIENKAENKTEEVVNAQRGKYLDYDYDVLYKKEDGRYAVTFNPFLPRNDTVVIGAIIEVINKTYGKNTVTDLEPKIVAREGKNLIMFKGTQGDYYFLLIKEDTGEVHSMAYWVE